MYIFFFLKCSAGAHILGLFDVPIFEGVFFCHKGAVGRALFSSKSGVVVVGANVIDMVAYTPSVPKMGETVLGRDFNVGFGGKGANQAVIAARMPGCEKVSMISVSVMTHLESRR